MRRLVRLLVITAFTGLAVTPSPVQSHPVLRIEARDFAFRLPATIRAGFVAVDLVNTGAEPHHAQIARLNDGVSRAQLLEALKKGPVEALRLVTLAGGPGLILPRGRSRVSVDLTPGEYVVGCFVESPDHTPHAAKGMLAFFTVTGNSAGGRLRSAGEIVLTDFTITIPAGFAGRGVYRMVNRGVEPHEVVFFRLAPGKTPADARAALAAGPAENGPPSIIPAGGTGGISRGRMNYLHLNLSRGSYVAVCLIPSMASGKPHVALGMMSSFEVK